MKYKLKFVNKGKAFEMPSWTVEKYEKLLDEMTSYEEKVKDGTLAQVQYDKLFRTKMILISLHEIDESVKESDLKTLHPEDLILLGNAVYTSGRVGIKEEDFQEEGKKAS
jgi:hypothetical protein